MTMHPNVSVPCPDVLYMYRAHRPSLAREIQTIRDNQIFFSTPDQFNDPFEVRPVILYRTNRSGPTADQIEAEHDRLFPNSSPLERTRRLHTQLIRFGDPRVVREYQENNIRDFELLIRGTSIACFSESNSDVQMWSYYATKHQGYCLGFKFESWRFKDSDGVTVGIDAHKVHYERRYPFVDAGASLDDDQATDRLFRSSLLTKARCWKFEKEWRFMRPGVGSGLQAFPASALRELILGSEIPAGRKRSLIGLVRKRSMPVKVFQAVREDKQYLIRLEPVDV